jgi:hypothetical protein
VHTRPTHQTEHHAEGGEEGGTRVAINAWRQSV